MRTRHADPHLISQFQATARIFALIVITLGSLVMVGWFFHIEMLKSLLPGLATMKFNTALNFVLAGIGLLNLKRHPRLVQSTAIIVFAIGALTFCEYVFTWDLGIDQLIVADILDTQSPGRMSLVTAYSYMLISLAMWFFVTIRYAHLAHFLTLSALLVSLIVLLGYIYSAEELYGIFWFTSMALHTAIGFVLLGLGLLLAYIETGPLRVISFATTGGYVARRFLPIIILIPLLGWLRWQGELAGYYNSNFGFVLFTLSNILILAIVTIRLGHVLHASDQQRMEILQSLQEARTQLEIKVEERTQDLLKSNQALALEVDQRKQTEAQFRTLLESAPDATVIVNAAGEIILVNYEAEKLFGYRREELIGKEVEMLLPAAQHEAHIAHRAGYGKNQRAREMGGSGLGLFALRKNGGQFPVEIKLSPIHFDNETLTFSSIRDVTERKEIEQSLRAAEEQLQTIFELMPVGASLIDSGRKIVRMNRALEKIMLMNMADLLAGKYRSRKYIHGDGTPMQLYEFPSERAFHEQKAIYDVELGVIIENGTTVWTSVSAAPLPSYQGVVIVTSDISERRHAEQTLRDSEEQFRATFDFAAIGMALVSLEGGWLKINPAVAEIVGYTQEELMQMTFQDITHPDDLNTDLAYLHQLLDDKIQSYTMEKRYFHKQGHIIWVLLSVSLVRNSEGRPMYFVSQIQNINARKLAEAALQTSLAEEKEFQEKLKVLHEITIELTSINDLDEFYQRAVQLGLERLGYERLGLLLYDKKLNQAVGTYGTDSQGNLVAEHHIRFEPDKLTNILSRALQQEERFVLDKDAELFSDFKPVGTGWNAVAVLWNGTENVGWLAADNGVEHKPVTKTMLDTLSLYSLTLGTLLVQKQTRLALQESESRFRRAVLDAPFPIMIHAEDGEILNMSHVWSDLTGYTPEELPTLDAWTEKAYGQRKEQVKGTIKNVYHQAGPFKGGEYRIRTKAGEYRVWDFIASPLGPLPDGRHMVSSMAMDITERKAAEEALQLANEQLQQANQEVQQFAYIVSHDLRTPLINLKGFSDILRVSVEQLQTLAPTITPVLDEAQAKLWESVTREKVPTAVRFINAAVDRMDQFTAAILRLSRLGHRPLAFERINVNALLPPIINSLVTESDPRGIEIEIGELPDVEADRIALDQIFGNIINNAIKYLDSGRKGRIVITGQQDNLQTTFHIQDNGRGIAPTQQDKIFAPFRRGISDVEGEGMGLAYVQALIKRHQGTIWFESTPGVGTTFLFTIPHRKASPDGSA